MKEEPINFVQERRRRRPEEQPPDQEASHPKQGNQTPQSPSQREPAPKQVPEPPRMGPRCTCCKHPLERVKVLLDCGGERLLCDRCIEVCNDILRDDGITTDDEPDKTRTTPSSSSKRTRYSCTFCRREMSQVARLIVMLNTLFICNTCVGICNTGLAQAQDLDTSPSRPTGEQHGETVISAEPVKEEDYHA